MKKYIILAIAIVLIIATFAGCNRMLMDTTYSFERAIIQLPNGKVIEGDVEGWMDFEDGDQIQVKINGITYLVHSSKVVLISE